MIKLQCSEGQLEIDNGVLCSNVIKNLLEDATGDCIESFEMPESLICNQAQWLTVVQFLRDQQLPETLEDLLLCFEVADFLNIKAWLPKYHKRSSVLFEKAICLMERQHQMLDHPNFNQYLLIQYLNQKKFTIIIGEDDSFLTKQLAKSFLDKTIFFKPLEMILAATSVLCHPNVHAEFSSEEWAELVNPIERYVEDGKINLTFQQLKKVVTSKKLHRPKKSYLLHQFPYTWGLKIIQSIGDINFNLMGSLLARDPKYFEDEIEFLFKCFNDKLIPVEDNIIQECWNRSLQQYIQSKGDKADLSIWNNIQIIGWPRGPRGQPDPRGPRGFDPNNPLNVVDMINNLFGPYKTL